MEIQRLDYSNFKQQDISEYFFSYIQFERNLDTLKENNLSLID